MYGVILWTDRENGRALIWCEDHGALAFFDAKSVGSDAAMDFDEGDLITFKLRDGGGMRAAYDIRVVACDEYPYLAQDLRETSAGEDSLRAKAPKASAGTKIVPFPPASGATIPPQADKEQATRKFGRA